MLGESAPDVTEQAVFQLDSGWPAGQRSSDVTGVRWVEAALGATMNAHTGENIVQVQLFLAPRHAAGGWLAPCP